MKAMSHTEEADYEFKWGNKKVLGNDGVQFYESFTYDGVEYFLYDCVYMHKEDEPEPYIGKLVKIWEQSNKKKRVKVVWFFRPIEVLNWLGDDVTLDNEIFLASGEGVGLANVNPLEVIAGKCNVICTSKDKRNPQPSETDLKMADYIFYRTFDVRNCLISDKLVDRISETDVRYFFNTKGRKPTAIPILKSNKDEDMKIDASKRALHFPSTVDSPRTLKTVVKDDRPAHVTSSSTKGAESNEVKTAWGKQEQFSGDKATPRSLKVKGKEGKAGKFLASQVEDREKLEYVKESSHTNLLDNKPTKIMKLLDNPAKLLEERQPNICSSLSLGREKTENSTWKVKPDEKIVKPSDGVLHTVAPAPAAEKGKKLGQISEWSKRPDPDRSKWFKKLPLEERIRSAHEQGTLVLLENLDPAYSSREVEDIVFNVFKEKCTAKMIQQTTFSSPHYGQALVIFKSREEAEQVINLLHRRCLMLSHGRPLVASRATPRVPWKPSKFLGHLSIDKINFLMQREEMRKAVSTSHFGQANTIEFDMALEWRLLQETSDIWWEALYKKHEEELKELKINLKNG